MKAQIPQGMRQAAIDAWDNDGFLTPESEARLEATLRWLHDKLSTLKRYDFNPHDGEQGMEEEKLGDYIFFADVAQMFVQPEPEMPEELKDVWLDKVEYMHFTCEQYNRALLEGFRRGQKAVGR
jgi:hypothetical protein